MPKTAKQQWKALLDEADLMQGFVDIVSSGMDALDTEELTALRAVIAAHEPTDPEEAAAKAIALWCIDHPDEAD